MARREISSKLVDRTFLVGTLFTLVMIAGLVLAQALLSERGVANDDTVVLYGGNNNWFAAYAYWYFKLYGHQDVRLLDGGRKKWELDARELTKDEPTRSATTYTAQEQDRSIRAFRDEVVEAIGVQNLVDVRSPD